MSHYDLRVTDASPTPTPVWLDPEESEAWLTLSGMTVALEAALDAQLRRDAGISHFDYSILAFLSLSPGRERRMSELATMAHGTLPRLSQVMTRFENRGWVERYADPDDGRYTIARLTTSGFEKIEAAAPAHVAEVRRLVFDPLSRTQVRMLSTITAKLLDNIEPSGSMQVLRAMLEASSPDPDDRRPQVRR